MRDFDIRYSLHNEFLAHFKQDGESVIVDELGVCNGKSIADVAVVNGALHGFEIKSESDTLLRLPSQVENYNKVFDYATIVINGKYINKISQLIPDWWAIWLVYEKDNALVMSEIRVGHRNQNLDKFSVAQLLWREEALDLLSVLGLAKGMKIKRRWLLWERLAADDIELDILCSHVRAYLKRRPSWKLSKFASLIEPAFSQNGGSE